MKSFVKRPKGSIIFTVRVTISPGFDKDLIEYLENVESGDMAGTVKKVLKYGIRAIKKEEEEKEEERKRKEQEENDYFVDLSKLGKKY